MHPEEFLQIIDSSAEAIAAELIISLPGNLTAAERRSAVEDFDLARAHLTFYFTSKLAYTAEEPWNVVILSHFDQHKARAAGRNVLRSRHPHPLMLRLRTDLRGQMQDRLAAPRFFRSRSWQRSLVACVESILVNKMAFKEALALVF